MSSNTLVEWREWSEEAFREAREHDRPILLDIGAVWCHWCHVMDTGIPGDPVHTGTYSDPQVAGIINSRFVPIKVDNDRRPDINARYNMGGWPTTAFLTPDGEPLYGETYVTPDRMLGLLNQIADYYCTNKREIAQRLAEHDAEEQRAEKPEVGALSSEIVAGVRDSVKAAFDFAYGGFGHQPKFPHPDALAFCLQQFAATGDAELRLIVEKTLDAMAGGGTYDRYAGGFFRYSTTRDWSIPHYEKMLEDNARLSRVCLIAARMLDEPRFAEVAKEVHGWLLGDMFDPAKSVFSGSQDADKEDAYYGLPLDKRATLPTPFIDRTAYCDWNALMVSSLVERYRGFDEPESLATAERTYAFLKSSIYPRHFYADGRPQGEEHLLGDETAMLDAALDLAEATGQAAYLADAEQYAAVLLGALHDAEHGGLFDLRPKPGALGALARPKKEIAGNSAAAVALLRLHAFTGGAEARKAAESALGLFAREYRRYSYMASAYALAVAAALETTSPHVVIVGDPAGAGASELRRAAWVGLRRNAGLGVVETRSADTAGEYPPDPSGAARAYVCVGTKCDIAVSAQDLTAKLRSAGAR